MLLLAYRALAAPTLALAAPFLALFNQKIRRGLKMRLRSREVPQFSSRPIWIHAASGEFEYAKPVIRELKSRHPELPIVVTYFSPTFAASVEKFAGVDYAQPLPLDLPGPTSSFLRRIKPRVLLLARTDFWPELLHQTRRRNIPIHVFSYTQKSGKARWLTRFQIDLVDQVECVSHADQEALVRANAQAQIAILGDTRYDQVRFRLSHPKPLPETMRPARTCLVAGSTWPEDEKVLLTALAPRLRESAMQMILVPHEPTAQHIEQLQRELNRLGLEYSLFSQQESWSDKSVLLVDRVGVLAELYLWGQMAFVGGSFKKSVHSVMEALGAGCLTFVGPYHQNNREALEFQNIKVRDRAPLQPVTDAKALADAVDLALAQKNDLPDFSQALILEFDRRLGSSHKLIERLQPYI